MPFRTDGIYFDEVLTDPTTPEEGQLWYNATDGLYKVYYQGTPHVLFDDGNQDLIDHTQLANIGTYSHAQIDTHIEDVNNPHAVTAAQVGLGNVTNDAQLKRAAGDFATFLDKTAPTATDILLIEDAADAGSKKYVQIGNLPGFQDPSTIAEAATSTTTTSTTDVLVTGMSITPESGTYLVWFSSSASNATSNNSVYVSIYAGGTQAVASERHIITKSAGDTGGIACSAKVIVNGTQTIEAQWRVDGSTGTLYQRTLVISKVA